MFLICSLLAPLWDGLHENDRYERASISSRVILLLFATAVSTCTTSEDTMGHVDAMSPDAIARY